MIHIRPASAGDHPRIRALIRRVRINPLDLDWRRFIVATTEDGALVGCGQVKPHKDGSYELASIAVEPAYRNQGIARRIVEQLIAAHPGDLYLTCRSRLGSFYAKFGFEVISLGEMRPYFRRITRLARALGGTGLVPMDLLVMKRTGDENRRLPSPSIGRGDGGEGSSRFNENSA